MTVAISRSRRRCPRCPRRMEELRFELASDQSRAVDVDRCPITASGSTRGSSARIMTRLRSHSGHRRGLVLEFLGETFAEDAARPTPSDGRRQ